MVFGPFLDFFGRTFSECRCRPDSKVDPIEFNPGAAINVGYHWLSFFKRLTVPPYAAIPTPQCKPPCRKKCCKPKRGRQQPCNVICQRKRKSQQQVRCAGPCCRPWRAPSPPRPAECKTELRRKRRREEPAPPPLPDPCPPCPPCATT